jgi:hypothetical protein
MRLTVYVYRYVCVCVCMCGFYEWSKWSTTTRRMHWMYVYVCASVASRHRHNGLSQRMQWLYVLCVCVVCMHVVIRHVHNGIQRQMHWLCAFVHSKIWLYTCNKSARFLHTYSTVHGYTWKCRRSTEVQKKHVTDMHPRIACYLNYLRGNTYSCICIYICGLRFGEVEAIRAWALVFYGFGVRIRRYAQKLTRRTRNDWSKQWISDRYSSDTILSPNLCDREMLLERARNGWKCTTSHVDLPLCVELHKPWPRKRRVDKICPFARSSYQIALADLETTFPRPLNEKTNSNCREIKGGGESE